MGHLDTQFSFGRGGLLPQEEMLEVLHPKTCLSIGIPKDMDENETRIAITPQATEILVENGYTILLEKDAGMGANFSNEKYANAGAKICDSKEDVYQADIVIKVAPFTDTEIKMVRERQTIISSYIINQEAEKTIKQLIKKKVTAIGFEYIYDLDGNYPVVRSLCEIAGSISIMVAAEYLSTANKGKGVMLGGVTGISPTEVVILGANTAGEFAARTAMGLGAHIKIFDNIQKRLVDIQTHLGQRVFTSNYQPSVLKKALKSAEVVIGAIQLVEEGTGFYVSEEMIKEMKMGSIIIDLSIDQGGCFETSRCTTLKSPVFKKHGVIHYCAPNITARVARTSSIALSNIFAPILQKMGNDGGISSFLKGNFAVRQGVYLYNGILTNSFISKRFGIPYKNIDLLMAAF